MLRFPVMIEQALELKLAANCWTSASSSRTLEDAQSVERERERERERVVGVNQSLGGGAAALDIPRCTHCQQ